MFCLYLFTFIKGEKGCIKLHCEVDLFLAYQRIAAYNSNHSMSFNSYLHNSLNYAQNVVSVFTLMLDLLQTPPIAK